MRSVLSADKTSHTNKEEVCRYKVTARDVLSNNIINGRRIINEFLNIVLKPKLGFKTMTTILDLVLFIF